MRKLIIVPMIHVIPSFEEKPGVLDFPDTISNASNPLVIKYWDIIKSKLTVLDPKNPHFYVDSYEGDTLTVQPGQEPRQLGLGDETVDQRIIKDFITRTGGIVERTEDPYLMRDLEAKIGNTFTRLSELTDYEDIRSAVGAFLGVLNEFSNDGDKITELRDKHIADTVSATLKEGEIGMLFLGAGHDVSRLLPADIGTELLDERLPDLHREIMEPRVQTENDLGINSKL